MLPTCQQMQEAEQRLFAEGAEAEDLMDRAGLGCALAVRQFFPGPGHATLFCGKGNNAGDALVIGAHLREWGWTVDARFSHEGEDELSPLARKKLHALGGLDRETAAAGRGRPEILVDGLLGIGASGELRGRIGELAGEINRIRNREHATCFAVDLPTGLDAKNGVVADFTLSVCEYKADLLEDSAVDRVGRLVKIELPSLSDKVAELLPDGGPRVAESKRLRQWLPPRRFGTHKGAAGRVAIVAGSRGLAGASHLSGLGALRGGAGLITVFVEESIYEVVAAGAPPELMIRPTTDFADVAGFNADVLAIGPGLGPDPAPAILDLMLEDPRPAVIDADGLNAIASRFPVDFGEKPRLLTPHPGEIARLIEAGESRLATAGDLAARTGAAVLHKGSRTVIAAPGEAPVYNSTGHPGLATGGIGDVLTGLCAALMAQRLDPFRAGVVGSWLIGRAAEIAIFEGFESAESLSATVIADDLGAAFQSLKAGEF